MTSKLTVKKKSVSFREDVLAHAQSQADKLHGGNLSAYLTFLVSMDKHGQTVIPKTEEVIIVEEEMRSKVNGYVKSEENEDFINQFLDDDDD